MQRLIVGLVLLSAVAVSAQAPKPRPPQTLPLYVQGQYGLLKESITGSAEKMPAEHFAFKPTPDVRSYAAIIGHTMETQYFYCSNAKGQPLPAIANGLEKKATDKAAVIQIVKDAFAYCDDAFAAVSNDSALEMITIGTAPNQRQVARVNQLMMVLTHGNEHYGNLVTYMRIKGIVPPSSAQ